jgi:hypothetical protein
LKNISVAANLFAAAAKWEVLGVTVLGNSRDSTGGLAPSLAWLFVKIESFLLDDQNNDYSVPYRVFLYLVPGDEYVTMYLFILAFLFAHAYLTLMLHRNGRRRQQEVEG